MTETTKIKAGWAVQIRAYGVRAPETPLATAIHLKGKSSDTNTEIFFEFAGKPCLSTTRARLNPYIKMDATRIIVTTHEAPDANDATAESSWLTVIAAKEFDVEKNVAAAFLLDRAKHTTAIDGVLEDAVRSSLKDSAEYAAAIIALSLPASVFELWQEVRVYWYNAAEFSAIGTTPVAQRLPTAHVANEAFPALIRQFASVMTADAATRRVLRVCCRWLIVAQSQPILSTERFVSLFQILEALCSFADQSPLPETIANFNRLNDAIETVPEAARQELREFIQRMKERNSGPSIAERFRRLATTIRPEHADNDVAAFQALTSVRNDLLHARITEPPPTKKGYSTDETVMSLAQNYLTAYLEHLAKVQEGRFETRWTGLNETPSDERKSEAMPNA